MTERKKNDEPFPKADRAEPQADGAPGTVAEKGGPDALRNRPPTAPSDRSAPKESEDPAPPPR